MTEARPSRAAAILRGILLVASGAAVALLLVLNPMRLPLPWSKPAPATAPAAATTQLWTCGMHPQVVQDHPGTCPICKMDLTPLVMAADEPAEAPAAKQLYTCGMHPQVVQDEPGTCPICKMDLTPLVMAADEPAPGERRILYYRNPMDPMVTSPVPMKDSMGMDYVPVYADEVGASAGPEVRVEPGLVQRLNITTAKVVREDLVRNVSTVGVVEYDHELETTVTVKYTGYVEHVHVHLVGEEVRRGQPLLDVYAPELVQTQQDLLAALAYASRMDSGEASDGARQRARDLVEAARQRLRRWDISAGQIARLEREGKVASVMTVTAPATGVVTKVLDDLAGMEIRPGMSIYVITDVSRVWVEAEIYEDQLAAVRTQERATVRLDAFPGESFEATVRAIQPQVDRQTRTVSLTLQLPNPGGRLRQGMYAQVEFAPVAARQVIVVPAQAVLRTGSRNVAVVARGEGRYAPREVVLGQESGGRLEVISGLSEGEEIVTSAQFLIDSESSLKAAVQAMIAGAPAKAE